MTPPSQSADHRSVIDDFPARYARTARFTLGTPRNIKVTANGDQVLFCRARAGHDSNSVSSDSVSSDSVSSNSDSGVLCLWAIDVASGAERIVVDPAELARAGAELPPAERARRVRARECASGIVAYSIDDAGRRACFALAGSLFVVDVATGDLVSPELAGTVYDPRLNGPGTAVAYVDGQDLRVVELADDGSAHDRLLRTDPDPAVSFGRAEFIAAEEMSRAAGYWWSPDGRWLAVSRVDENPVGVWWIADPAHPERAPHPVRYPAAGTANAAVGLELVGLDGTVVEVDWSDGGHFEYLADVVWPRNPAPGPFVVRQSRDQRTVSVAGLPASGLPAAGVPASGLPVGGAPVSGVAVSERHRITDEVWVELVPGSPHVSRSGLLTIEDRGAARRLVLDGRALTGDDLQVRALIDVVDLPDGGEAALLSVTTVPTEIHLALVALTPDDRNGTVLLTSEPGVHGGVVDGTTIVVSFTGPGAERTRSTIHRLVPGHGKGPEGTGVVLSEPVAEITDRSSTAGFAAAPTFCQLGPTRLEAAIFLPSDHDGERPLPVLLDPYGGPHAQRVLKNHNPHLVSRWFAEQGYAVVVADGRGTPGRGPAWERAVWGDLAGPVLDDQLAALDAALERHPFLDAGRVGIRGWSFGGFLAALAVLRRPDRFHAAVAGAPVTTWRLYDTHYTERYLGHPDTHPGHYDRSGLWAEGPDGPELPDLERPLLLIHGLADDNVVAAHTLRFSTILLAAGSPHRVLPLSGVTHMTPQLAVAENLLRLQLDFLDETVGGARP